MIFRLIHFCFPSIFFYIFSLSKNLKALGLVKMIWGCLVRKWDLVLFEPSWLKQCLRQLRQCTDRAHTEPAISRRATQLRPLLARWAMYTSATTLTPTGPLKCSKKFKFTLIMFPDVYKILHVTKPYIFKPVDGLKR